jgi:transcriptional regulator with XRE-family HTH domain
MYELMNSKEIMLEIAQKVKTKRISLDYTQEAFSAKSGVALSTYRTFEKSGKGSFENFISVLSALGSVSELERLLPQTTFSPVAEFNKKKKKERMRVKKKSSDTSTSKNHPIKKSSSLLDAIKARNEKK